MSYELRLKIEPVQEIQESNRTVVKIQSYTTHILLIY